MSDLLVLFLITFAVVAVVFFFAIAKAAKMGDEAERRWREELDRIERTFRNDDDDTRTWPGPGAEA